MSDWELKNCDAADEFTTEDAERLLIGKLPGIRCRKFVSEKTASSILKAIDEVGLEYYVGADKSGGEQRKGKLGPNFYRFKDDPPEYFDRVGKFKSIFEGQIFKQNNPPKSLMRLCERAFNRPARIASENGQEFMISTVRDLPSAPVHYDWLPVDCPNLKLPKGMVDQFAWNLFLELPEDGGYTLIHNHDARESEFPSDSLWAGVTHARCDLTFFRSTYRHSVVPSEGIGRRITLSGFFGVWDDKLIFWV